jgi:hypothetical protein
MRACKKSAAPGAAAQKTLTKKMVARIISGFHPRIITDHPNKRSQGFLAGTDSYESKFPYGEVASGRGIRPVLGASR